MSKKDKKTAPKGKKATTGGEQSPVTPKEWNVVWRPVEELTPYQNNARINDQTVPYLKNSIKRFGFKNPIIIDKDGVIIAGHTRLKAALELGYTKLPCVCADDLTPAEVKAFRLVDNKVAELSSWDYGILDEEMKGLEDDGFGDMGDFGFASFDGDTDLGEGQLPPELAGKDLEPDKLPDAGGEAETCPRVVISFDEEERAALAERLGLKVEQMPSSKISYTWKEIVSLSSGEDSDGEAEA